MILQVLSWWVVSTILGAAAFPIGWRIFSRLPDRGYGFMRTLGLLLCGYGFWLGASLQILPNSSGALVVVILALISSAIIIGRRDWQNIIEWLRTRRRTIIAMEALFVISLVAWAFVRANNPEITGTEKPMELAFINAILKSDGFPPRDPWLSGYAISYYYFGYVLISMLTRLTGVTAGVAFNLGNSLWFALVAVGSYSILYNLLNRSKDGRHALFPPLLGPLMTLVSGNLAGFLEVLHSRHLFWKAGVDGIMRSPFWTWIGLEDLERAPSGTAGWLPDRFLWWWRSSRVVRDLDLSGVPIGTQSIDEFPFFSFLLADNHPHLLALPVVLLALGFTLQVGLNLGEMNVEKRALRYRFVDFKRWIVPTIGILVAIAVIRVLDGIRLALDWQEIIIGTITSLLLLGFLCAGVLVVGLLWAGRWRSPLSKAELIFGAWLFGALAFLNTWDFPIYISVISLVFFWRFRQLGLIRSIRSMIPVLISFVFLGVLFYLPWYPTFASQAGGILPQMLQPTRFIHFFIMFAPSFTPISIWLLMRLFAGWERREWRWLIGLTFGIPLSLLLISWFLAAAIILGGSGALSPDLVLGTVGVTSMDELVRQTLRIRLSGSWTALALGGMIASAVVLLRRIWSGAEKEEWPLFIIIVGALLIIGPEFLYLRDQFGLRMNTIFKFYFAAWIMWSLAASYLVLDLWGKRGRRWLPLQSFAILPLLLGLFYPVLSVWTKTQQFQPTHGVTLEGGLHPAYMHTDDRDAVNWMNAYLADGVLVEAVGGSYTYYTRVSTHTGMPTVLGWPGHEGQWRGGYEEQGSRQEDIRHIYQSPDWPTTLEILDRYDIDYIYIGDLERQAYAPLYEAKFEAFMNLIYTNNSVRIYAQNPGGMP